MRCYCLYLFLVACPFPTYFMVFLVFNTPSIAQLLIIYMVLLVVVPVFGSMSLLILLVFSLVATFPTLRFPLTKTHCRPKPSPIQMPSPPPPHRWSLPLPLSLLLPTKNRKRRRIQTPPPKKTEMKLQQEQGRRAQQFCYSVGVCGGV